MAGMAVVNITGKAYGNLEKPLRGVVTIAGKKWSAS